MKKAVLDGDVSFKVIKLDPAKLKFFNEYGQAYK